jgi:hypothetical protein
LALNPYNFFDQMSRSTLIAEGIQKPINSQLAKYNASKNKPKDLIKRTEAILTNVAGLNRYFFEMCF